MIAKYRIMVSAPNIRNTQKGTVFAVPFCVFSAIQRLVIRHIPEIRFQISVVHQVCIFRRVIVDQIIQLRAFEHISY